MSEDRQTTALADFYLWHLEHIGVLRRKSKGSGYDTGLWTKACEAAAKGNQVTVALIDTGIDPGHPNLKHATKDFPQVDFGPSLAGVVYAGATGDNFPTAMADDDVNTILNSVALVEDEAALSELFRTTLTRTSFDTHKLKDSSIRFGAHGTCCAGLVAASGQGIELTSNGPIRYYGVNPFCKLLSIATPYSHEILPVIQALLLALRVGAKVILMPRGLPDAVTRGANMKGPTDGTGKGSPYGTRIDSEVEDAPDVTSPGDHASLARLTRHQEIFKALLSYASSKAFVVLAAGNEGRAEELAYPATLVTDMNDLIVVAARNRNGHISSYSNGLDRKDLFWMLSDDGFAFNDRKLHYDEDTYDGSEMMTPPVASCSNLYSPWGILTTDVRGPWGYSAAARSDPPDDDAGEEMQNLYTIFGGTSAASSLTAGLIALLLQAGEVNDSDNRDALKKKLADYYPNVVGGERPASS